MTCNNLKKYDIRADIEKEILKVTNGCSPVILQGFRQSIFSFDFKQNKTGFLKSRFEIYGPCIVPLCN